MTEESQLPNEPAAEAETPVKTYDLGNPGELVSLIKDEPDEAEVRKHIAAHIRKLIDKGSSQKTENKAR